MEYHFPIPGSIQEEKVILFTRKHWAAFLGQAVLSTVLILLPVTILLLIRYVGHISIAGLWQHFLVLGLSTYYLIILTYAFTAWLSFYYDIYVITKDTVIDVVQQGFFGRKISQLSLLRVQDVTSNVQGVFATFFGYGNVLVETAGEQSQNFLIQSIPRPQEVCAKIMELHDQVIAAQGREQQVTSGEGTLNPNTNLPKQSVSPTSQPGETPYQKMLREQSSQGVAAPEEKPIPEAPRESKPEGQAKEGEVGKDDLNQGGTINLN